MVDDSCGMSSMKLRDLACPKPVPLPDLLVNLEPLPLQLEARENALIGSGSRITPDWQRRLSFEEEASSVWFLSIGV